MPSEIVLVELSKLIEPWSMLRPVLFDSLEYMELVDSIRENGLLNSILIRPHFNRDRYYEIIDGLWRFNACKEAGLREVPCIIKTDVKDDRHYLALQIQANAVSYETKPIQFAEQMQKIMNLRESLGAPISMSEIGREVGKSASWVSTRLRLLSLHNEVQDALNTGKINLTQAVAISKVKSKNEQRRFLLKATTILTTRELELEVGRYLAERDFTHRADSRARDYELFPIIQKMDVLLIELDNLTEISEIIVKKGLTTPLQGAKAMLEWVLNLHEDGRAKIFDNQEIKLTSGQRMDILGRQQYEEIKKLADLKELVDKQKLERKSYVSED